MLPNYRWLPVGYHGRASSVQVSGTPFRRPRGQLKASPDAPPAYAPTERLDLELELGIWIGPGNAAGEPVPISRAADQVAGYCLLNDWSARDVQAWEYQPLGPFLAKSFATTVSAWVVTPEALAPFRAGVDRPGGDPPPLPYLRDDHDQRNGALDVGLEVLLSTAQMRAEQMPPHLLSASSTRHLYWTPAQLITHHTSGGCNLRPGDLLGTGTISAPISVGYGSLLEITRRRRRADRAAVGRAAHLPRRRRRDHPDRAGRADRSSPGRLRRVPGHRASRRFALTPPFRCSRPRCIGGVSEHVGREG